MDFYFKKYTAAPKFQAHYNRTLGKYYSDKQEYYSDLKKQGLEPYAGEVTKRKERKYKPSPWARDIAKAIERRGGAGGAIVKEINKNLNIKAVPSELMKEVNKKAPKGGWF